MKVIMVLPFFGVIILRSFDLFPLEEQVITSILSYL